MDNEEGNMAQIMNIPILFEDADLAVVNKAPGVVVNKASTVKEETIQDWWEERLSKSVESKMTDWKQMVPADFPHEYGTPEEIFAERGGVAHRLDKETSGVLVLAKNPGSLAHLLRQFRLRETTKMYTCLVHGKFSILEDTVSLPLGRAADNRTKFTVDAEGRAAETHYKVTTFYPQLDLDKVLQNPTDAATKNIQNLRKKLQNAYQGFSLVQCWPKTGRTHQLRVHLSHLKHPIVADATYLGKKRQSFDALWCPRLFLHATTLEFTHPRTGERQKFSADIWPDLQTALEFLRQ